MKLFKPALILSLSMLTSAAFASSAITLSGTQKIAPNSDALISLAPLKAGIEYRIRCELNNSNQENVMIGVNAFQPVGLPPTIRVPNAPWATNKAQGEIPPGVSTVQICPTLWAPPSSPDSILNLDNELSIELISCVAEPITSNC